MSLVGPVGLDLVVLVPGCPVPVLPVLVGPVAAVAVRGFAVVPNSARSNC